MPNSPEPPETSPGKKATGSLRAGTGSLRAASEAAAGRTAEGPVSAFRFPAQRSLGLRIGELVIFVAAIVGAVALGLGISDYLGAHPYIFGYLAAYAAFRFADLLVRGDRSLTRLSRRVTSQLPLLALFAGAPFERTYIYGGEAPRWLAGLGLLIELAGLWVVLGARVQLGFFSSSGGRAEQARPLVRNGLFRYIRHPTVAGEMLVLLAWPFEFAAPITLIVALIILIVVAIRIISEEEAEMLAEFGDEYAAYIRQTDSLIPNVW